MKAVKVRKEKAEEIRKWLEKEGCKDKKRRIRAEGDFVLIPVVDEFNIEGDYEIVDDINPVFKTTKNFREILEEIAGFYPKYADFKIYGKIGVLKLPESVQAYSKKIAIELMKYHRLDAVWLERGKEGMLRKPRMELLAGNCSIAEVKEYGWVYRFDVTKVMFSQGNKYEKLRIANLVKEGEIVVDMFAGIGYFTIPIGKLSKAHKIYSFEINPDSYEFLLENLRLNRIKNAVPVLGDSMKTVPENFADRIVMGHIKCHEFLPTAIGALRDEGWIHYHEATPERVLERPVERVRKYAEVCGARVLDLKLRKVKNYSPGVYHVVVDARIVKK